MDKGVQGLDLEAVDKGDDWGAEAWEQSCPESPCEPGSEQLVHIDGLHLLEALLGSGIEGGLCRGLSHGHAIDVPAVGDVWIVVSVDAKVDNECDGGAQNRAEAGADC